MTFFKWSQTAATNATADSTINWAEGQAPSSVNDSARGMMAAAAKYRDDIAGAITTSGTATAFVVTSFQVFTSLATMSGQMIAFTPHTTNGATVTLNVDGLGVKPLRTAPSVELSSGTLVQGTPYVALYNNSTTEWLLHGFYSNPYNMPLGGMMDYVGTTAPNSSFVLPFGQALSRTTYATLYALTSTTFGNGDSTSTFNVIDMRGRIGAGKGDMGGSDAARLTATYFGAAGTTLGATGGSESHPLTLAQLASHTHAASVTDPGHTHPTSKGTVSFAGGGGGSGGTLNSGFNLSSESATTGITVSNTSTGGGTAHNNVQPTIIVNKILRVL